MSIGIRKFNGKTFNAYTVRYTKEKAKKIAKKLREAGMNARITQTSEAGKKVYWIWTRYKGI